jgi:aryl-alcohol dehydrogenase-like predicted oxidoreductase
MDTRHIGSLEVSAVGLGCNNFGWRIDERGTAAVVDAALAAGITFFDTADIYGGTKSEELLGRALGKRREQVVIATKFGMQVDAGRQGARPECVRRALDDSLRRLGTERIDLYQLHQPDPTVPIAETLGALDDAVRAGKVREIGCSNFSAEQILEAEKAAAGHARFVSVQNDYSLLHREPEREVLPVCERLRLAFLPYFPLASGLLTGKYRRGQSMPEGTRLSGSFGQSRVTDEKLTQVEALMAFAESRGHQLLALAFAWLLAHRVVSSVIAGATSPAQVQANVAAATGWRLTEEDLAALDGILAPA